MQKKICLVTGAAGFTAEHLIPKLRAQGWYILGTDKQVAPSSECDEYISGDLSDEAVCATVFKDYKIDLCIHLAAARADWGVSDEEFQRDNVTVTANLINCFESHKVNSCVFISSISVMPQNTNTLLNEQANYEPINTYGLTKMKCEKLFIEYCKHNPSFHLNILRPAVLYGPSDPNRTGMYRAMDNNIFRLIDAIYKKRFAIVGNGKNVKTTAYVKNFADAIIHLIPKQPNFDIYVICDPEPLSTNQLVFLVRDFLGKSGYGPRIPMYIAKPLGKIFDVAGKIFSVNFPINSARVETFNRPTNFSSKKLMSSGFTPKYNTCAALKETVSWYLELQKNHKLNTFFVLKK